MVLSKLARRFRSLLSGRSRQAGQRVRAGQVNRANSGPATPPRHRLLFQPAGPSRSPGTPLASARQSTPSWLMVSPSRWRRRGALVVDAQRRMRRRRSKDKNPAHDLRPPSIGVGDGRHSSRDPSSSIGHPTSGIRAGGTVASVPGRRWVYIAREHEAVLVPPAMESVC